MREALKRVYKNQIGCYIQTLSGLSQDHSSHIFSNCVYESQQNLIKHMIISKNNSWKGSIWGKLVFDMLVLRMDSLMKILNQKTLFDSDGKYN